jgi:hypothetical protein
MSGRPVPPDGPLTIRAIRDARTLILNSVGEGTAFERALDAGCSESTMRRIIEGDANLSIRTIARILEHCGYQLVVSKIAQDVVSTSRTDAA